MKDYDYFQGKISYLTFNWIKLALKQSSIGNFFVSYNIFTETYFF